MSVPLSMRQSVRQSPIKTDNIPYLEVTKIFPLWPKRVFIQWVLRNPEINPSYNFNIFRSGSPEGPWTNISGNLVDEYFFVDEDFPAPNDQTDPGLFSMKTVIYYKITAQAVIGGEVYSVIKSMEPWLDHRRVGIHRKLVRDALIALKKIVGTEIAVLQRRKWGEKCSQCVTTTGQSSRASCPICYGTTFVGGYWNPVYGYARLFSTPVNIQTAPQGEVEIHRTQITMSNFPEVYKRDIIVFIRNNRRFTVLESNETCIHNVGVHQELTVSELNPSSVEHKINVDPWREPCWWKI
jgi:hypothetical protein